jgi:drug/metabolite transporter (DMT)-like permease
MNEKTLVIVLAVLLGLGFVGVLFVIVPWFGSHGVSNWKQVLMDDGLILLCLALFVYGFYMNTKMH